MTDPPEGASRWSVNNEISMFQSKNIFYAIFYSLSGFISILATYKVLNILNLMNVYVGLILGMVVAWLLWKNVIKTNRKIHLLNQVAIGEGHPWHPSEEMGDTSVWINDGEKWILIPPKVRIFVQSEPILNHTIMRVNDENGKIILKWPQPDDEIVRKIVSIINQALAFRDAQDRDITDSDPIESARDREEKEFYPKKREWGETTPGSLTPQPGALLRQMKLKRTDIHENKED